METEPVKYDRMSKCGATFAEALENFLDSLALIAFSPDQSSGTRSTRFQSEAVTLQELVRNAFDAVMTLAADLEQAVNHVTVDGHRPIEGGHRCWGTMEFAPSSAAGRGVVIVDGPHVSFDEHESRWRIDAGFVSD